MFKYVGFKSVTVLLVCSLASLTVAAQEHQTGLIEEIRSAVVAVTVYNDEQEIVNQVSGFFINPEGHLLTCRNVVRGASRIQVTTRDGKAHGVRMVLSDDPNLDVIKMLVDLPDPKVPYLRIKPGNADRGDRITVFGHQQTVKGAVSFVRQLEKVGRTFQFQGDSDARGTGGPVVNQNGDIVAIATEATIGNWKLTLAVHPQRLLAMASAPSTISDWNRRIKGERLNCPEASFFAGVNLVKSEQYDKALPLLEEAALSDVQDAEARFNCGYSKVRLGRSGEALKDYQEAVRIEPTYIDALNRLSVLYYQLGRFEESATISLQAIKLQPDYAEAYTNLGAAYDSLGRKEEAIAAHERAIELHPGLASAHNNLGMVYYRLGRLDEALQAINRAIKLRPDFARAVNNLGRVYLKLNNYRAAEAAFRQAIIIDAGLAEAVGNLGVVQCVLGQDQEALESLKRATQLKPDFVEAHYNIGMLCIKIGREQDAVAGFEQALRIKPQLPEAANQVGLVHFRAKRHKESIQFFRHAIRVDPNFAEAHYNLALSYLLVRDTNSAFEVYDALKSLNEELAGQLLDIISQRYVVGVSRRP
jgi:tetratricopeptide (TPR) repeat protein